MPDIVNTHNFMLDKTIGYGEGTNRKEVAIEIEMYIQRNATAQLLHKQNKLKLKTLTTTKYSMYNYCVVLESIDGMYFDYILCSPKMEK